MPWILRPSCDYAGRVAGGRDAYTRAHVLEVSRVFKQDYRTVRRVEEHLSHLDLGPSGDPHDSGPRGLRSQGAKDSRRNDLKLRAKPILQLRSKDRREVVHLGSICGDQRLQARAEAKSMLHRVKSLQDNEVRTTSCGSKLVGDPRKLDPGCHSVLTGVYERPRLTPQVCGYPERLSLPWRLA